MDSTRHGPGLARADRRELRLLRDWLSRPDEPELGAALLALIEDGDAATAERFASIQRLVAGAPARWTAARCGASLVFRDLGSPEPLELWVHDDSECTIVTRRGTPTPASDEIMVELDEAIDAALGRVLAWVRRDGAPPHVASRLATLFAP